MCIPIRALLRRDVVHDTMEDVMAGPNPGAMLENARAWITASRTTVAGGGSSDRHVDAVTLYFLTVKWRATWLHSQIKCVHLNVKKYIKILCPTLLGSHCHNRL